jgi:hypothetical protein
VGNLLKNSHLGDQKGDKAEGCEDGMWIRLAQDHVKWWSLILVVKIIQVLLPELFS